MSWRPFGLGMGVIALIVIWTGLLALGALRARKRGNVIVSLPFVLLAALLTACLVLWPRKQASELWTDSFDRSPAASPYLTPAVLQRKPPVTGAGAEQTHTESDLNAKNTDNNTSFGGSTPKLQGVEVDWMGIPRIALAAMLILLALSGSVWEFHRELFRPKFVPPPRMAAMFGEC